MLESEGNPQEVSSMKSEKSAGAVIFRREDGKLLYLLLLHPTYWGFVKGIVEKNESEEETAKREAQEEAGLTDISILKGFKEGLKWFYKFENELINKEAVFFLAETKTKNVKISSEHNDFKWCSFEDAINLMDIENNRELLKKADNFLKKYINHD